MKRAWCIDCKEWRPQSEFAPMEVKCRGHRAALPLARMPFPRLTRLVIAAITRPMFGKLHWGKA